MLGQMMCPDRRGRLREVSALRQRGRCSQSPLSLSTAFSNHYGTAGRVPFLYLKFCPSPFQCSNALGEASLCPE